MHFFDWLRVPFFLAVLSAVAGCVSPSYVRIDYRPPFEPRVREATTVFIDVRDERSNPQIIGAEVRREFDFFSGNFGLSLERGILAGVYDVRSLFREAFRRRLEKIGIKVLAEPEDDIYTIAVHLKRFELGAERRKWTAMIDYDALLSKGGKELIRERLSGKKERVKLVGVGEAEEMLSELFTDIVNKPDIASMFREAGK
jgi:hypothetical protein